MDKNLLEDFLKLIGSENDSDAVMGLRGAQNLFRSTGASLEAALRYAADNFDRWGSVPDKTTDHQSAATPKAAPARLGEASGVARAVNMSAVPECRVSAPGAVEIVLSGKAGGDIYKLPGAAAQQAEDIALRLKDAVIAAVINKSRFKLKLQDVKSGNGDIIETILQAEYERQGMIPIRIWVNGRGEVGALAAVLRKAIATSLPELAA